MTSPRVPATETVQGTVAFDRGLRLLDCVVRDDGQTPLSVIARSLGIPHSTARRYVASLERNGLLARVGHGRYAAGRSLATLAPFADPHTALVRTSRPLLRKLARRTRATVHLGVLEGEMITYLVKEHGGGGEIFTRAGSQLEGYCTAVGKMLLAMLDDAERDIYLGSAPFVALTERTVTAPDAIRTMLSRIRRRGYATEDGETAEGLRCLAVPVRSRAGGIVASISIARLEPPTKTWEKRLDLAAAKHCAAALSHLLAE